MIEWLQRHATVPVRAVSRHVRITFVVSALYIFAYWLSATLVAPVQEALMPSVVMSLMFFPHGLRVIAAWLYGWNSVFYILPGALLCSLHFAGERALELQMLAGAVTSLLCAPLAFALFRRLHTAEPLGIGQARMMVVVEVGIFASMLNVVALCLIYGLDALEGAVTFVGDTSGLLASLLIIWTVLRIVPRRG